MEWSPGPHAVVAAATADNSVRDGHEEVKVALPSAPTDTAFSDNRGVSPAFKERDGQPSRFCVTLKIPATSLESDRADEENYGDRGQPRTLHGGLCNGISTDVDSGSSSSPTGKRATLHGHGEPRRSSVDANPETTQFAAARPRANRTRTRIDGSATLISPNTHDCSTDAPRTVGCSRKTADHEPGGVPYSKTLPKNYQPTAPAVPTQTGSTAKGLKVEFANWDYDVCDYDSDRCFRVLPTNMMHVCDVMSHCITVTWVQGGDKVWAWMTAFSDNRGVSVRPSRSEMANHLASA